MIQPIHFEPVQSMNFEPVQSKHFEPVQTIHFEPVQSIHFELFQLNHLINSSQKGYNYIENIHHLYFHPIFYFYNDYANK